MTKQEFEKKIGAEISQKDYSIVELSLIHI